MTTMRAKTSTRIVKINSSFLPFRYFLFLPSAHRHNANTPAISFTDNARLPYGNSMLLLLMLIFALGLLWLIKAGFDQSCSGA